MTPTIADLARMVLDGADRNDDAKKLARWVLEHLERCDDTDDDTDDGDWCTDPDCWFCNAQALP